MSGSLNRATLIGNLGNDPECKTLDGGTRVASFSVATNESFTNKAGEKVDRVEWHRITAWGDGLVDKVIGKFLKKGSRVFVEGMIRTRKYTDKEGVERWSTEIHVGGLNSQIVLLGDAGGNRAPAPSDDDAPASMQGAKPAAGATPGKRAAMDDEIPF